MMTNLDMVTNNYEVVQNIIKLFKILFIHLGEIFSGKWDLSPNLYSVKDMPLL